VKRRLLSIILCAVMLLSMAACAGDTPVPAPDAEPTATPEPPQEIDPLELALEKYGVYMTTEYGISENMCYSLESSIVRAVGERSYEEKAKETVIYQGKTIDEATVLRDQKLSYYGQDTYVEYLYADGTVYVDGLYKAEMSYDDFVGRIYPMHLVEPSLYEDISLEGEDIVLSSPTAPESWLGGDIELIDASAKIDMSGSDVESISYEAEYMQNHVKVNFSIKATPEDYDAARDLAAEIPGATGLKAIPDMYVPEYFNKASIALNNSDCQSITSTYTVDIEILDFEFNSALETHVFGSGADLAMLQAEVVNYRQGWTEDGWVASSSYNDGVYRYAEDGEVYEQTVPASALNMDSVMFSNLFALRNLSDFRLSYPEGYILIEFQVDPTLGSKTQEDICGYLFDWPTRLDEMATGFNTLGYEGYLAFDADTMLPTAYGSDFRGEHIVFGSGRDISEHSVASFNLLSGSAQLLATGEAPEEAEPENKATPLFYKVSGESGQTMWLFGTIHLGDERTAFLPDSIYKALDQSNALALEVNPGEVQSYLNSRMDVVRILQDKMYYINGSTLADNIDPQLYEKAEKLMKATGSYAYRAEEFTPTVWADAIEAAYIVHVDQLSADFGLENRLVELAAEKGMEIRSIEDIGDQLLFFYKFPAELQELILYDMVNYGREKYSEELMELYELWCAGDEEALREYICSPSVIEFGEEALAQISEEEMAQIEALLAEYDKAIGPDRNANMIETAIKYLESGETVFYAVGLAHLLDETGLIEGLREAGYTVELVG